jgi:hypothetical protein
MIQGTLFDLPTEPAIAVEPVLATGLRCRKCKFVYKHQYGKMKYCSKQSDKKTAYGHKKIKTNSHACEMFEPNN